ncbi:MAG: prenyltransferase [Bdellovibrionota bacterium]
MLQDSKIFMLEADSPGARSALLNGWIEVGQERVRVVAEEVLEGPVRTIAFKRVDRPRPARIKALLVSLRAVSLTATALPGFAVLSLGLLSGLRAELGFFVLALLGTIFLQIGVNVLNDVEDHLKLIDLPGSSGGSQTIQRGWLSAYELRIVGYLSLAIGVGLGLPVLMRHWQILVPVRTVALIGSLGYSSKPLGLKYRALGDIAVFLMCGPLLTAGYSMATFSAVIPGVYHLGFFFGLLACGILHINNIQDIRIDTLSGARTLAAKLGFEKSRLLLTAFYVLAYLSLGVGVLQGVLHPAVLFSILAIPFFAKILSRSRVASGPDSPALNGLRVMAAQGHLIAGLTMLVALSLARYIASSP